MRATGIEPARLATPDPKSDASAWFRHAREKEEQEIDQDNVAAALPTELRTSQVTWGGFEPPTRSLKVTLVYSPSVSPRGVEPLPRRS